MTPEYVLVITIGLFQFIGFLPEESFPNRAFDEYKHLDELRLALVVLVTHGLRMGDALGVVTSFLSHRSIA